ncbi:hypothetical protein [Azohydromonas lata]|uniref:Uncharacterized protein n=1 Tax=Azohydromonas lata TaxID=45677 RepID=A0ABU5IJP2_9BURK|nr:hypothetical protein [Azohydromonas lata]MDZ5459120.1 hypothetical protein [Azohydromonas lata]
MVEDGTAFPTTLAPRRRWRWRTAAALLLPLLLAHATGSTQNNTPRLRPLAANAPALAPASRMPPAAASRHAAIDAVLAADLLAWASRLSGLPNPPGEALPRFIPLPQREIARTVCDDRPAGCESLVAVYDTDRRHILYRDTLDMRDPTDQSFIVHELVHHLQFLQRGESLFASCQSTLSGEAQAYRVQNLYQDHFRQWQRMGEVLRYMHCDGSGAEPVARLMGLPGMPAR